MWQKKIAPNEDGATELEIELCMIYIYIYIYVCVYGLILILGEDLTTKKPHNNSLHLQFSF